jgi:hypothetical protein
MIVTTSRFSSEYSLYDCFLATLYPTFDSYDSTDYVIAFQLPYVLPSISHNSTDYVMSTTPPKAPIAFNSPPKAPITFDSPLIDYDLIISNLINSDLDLHIKLDAL